MKSNLKWLTRYNSLALTSGGYFFYRPTQAGLLALHNVLATYPDPKELINCTDWHVTVMHSSVTGGMFEMSDLPTTATLTHFEVWTDHKDREILVALFDFPRAEAQHRAMTNAGWQHSYHEYNPHTTLCKGTTNSSWARLNTNLNVPVQFTQELLTAPLI